MTDQLLIPLPGIGTLALSREAFEQALAEGSQALAVPAPSSSTESEPLLEAEELAAAMKLPVSWIEQAAREGRVPSIQAGRWRRFKRSSVERALEKHKSL